MQCLVLQGLGVLMAAIFLAGQMAGVGVLALPAALIVNIFLRPLPQLVLSFVKITF